MGKNTTNLESHFMLLQSNECSKKDLNQNNETMNSTFVKIQQLRYHNFIDTPFCNSQLNSLALHPTSHCISRHREEL